LFVDEIDKIHGLVIEAKEADPFFEVQVLIFHFLDDGGEHRLHLFLKHKHLWNFSVGVLANDVFKFCPLHFLALIVEEGTFAFCGQTLLTNEGRFPAVCVYTNHETLVPVYAVRGVFDRLAHCQENQLNIR